MVGVSGTQKGTMQVLPEPGSPPSSPLSLGAYSYPAQPEVTPDAVFEDWVAPF